MKNEATHHIGVSGWVSNPDDAYDSLRWPIPIGDSTNAINFYYDRRFLRFEWAWFGGFDNRYKKCRLTALVPEVS